ncbi:MAG: 1,4-dihydroxy-2-naphthoate polyprenyltransferase [Acidimicrobiaceae bacterium]|nr:1,4-dihydroxy-2-naphthoate polyprenyltransferase [Ilumatobacter sp.]MCB9379790.1 1,4-dihydroxy-2-naphthoate polyprenyltransferase [Acidimicrobiaceae bacterium]MCO5328978.1 1,4-dihydroxy-2-naphthoate polyprenyltransferase [Ilumatobacteraceae bacterium]
MDPRPSSPWVLGARPRTLPAAVVPVALGAAAAAGEPGTVWWRVGPALLVSLALQVGVNYANDYSDGVRGTDEVRVGPVRLVAGGLKPAVAVKRAAFLSFGVAAVAGLALAAVTSWWLLAVGAAALLAGWFYTGGPKPYGYLGLGEVFVFVFFGLVATAGTTYVIAKRITAIGWLAGCAAGCLACALLVINNLRDIPTDREVGKRTLAVRLGDRATRWFYTLLLVAAGGLVVAVAVAGRPWAAVGVAGLVAAVPGVRAVMGGATGRALIPVLGATGRTQMLVGALAALGMVVSR